MHIRPTRSPVEFVDPRRSQFDGFEISLVNHADFERRDWSAESHSGVAVATWNRTFRGGFCRTIQGAPYIDHLTEAIRLYHNPNVVLVPSVDGCTELHAALASLLPDSWLQRRGIPRPTANFELWPFCSEWFGLDRRRIARQIESAFQQYIWKRVAKVDSLRHISDDSSIRLVQEDPQRWMHALYEIALRRAETACAGQEPVNYGAKMRDDLMMSGDKLYGTKTTNLGDGRFMVISAQGDPAIIRVPEFTVSPTALSFTHPKTREPMLYRGVMQYPTAPATRLWDPHDADDREGVVQELIQESSLGQALTTLIKTAHPEEYRGGRGSLLRIAAEKRWEHRAKAKVQVSETYDDRAVYDGQDPMIEARDIVRGALAIVNARERFVLLQFAHGRTLNEIAEMTSFVDHSGVKRMLDRLFQRIRQALRVQPAS